MKVALGWLQSLCGCLNILECFEGVCALSASSCHPGLRRGRNTGFDMLSLTSFPVAGVARVDPLLSSRKLYFEQHSHIFVLFSWQARHLVKSKVAEILIQGIPEASGLCGSIRLVKLVLPLLARAYNLSYGAKIDHKCTTNQNISKAPDPPPQRLLCYIEASGSPSGIFLPWAQWEGV